MSRKRYLCVRNFDETQHYRDRNPIWIKLPCAILDDYEFAQIPDETKFHAVGLMLLASRLNNKFPEDESWLRQKINANSEINLKLLLEIEFLEVIKDAKMSEKKAAIARKCKKTQDHLASTTFKTALAQNRTEQKKTEHNTTEHNTTEQTRAETGDAENAVVAAVCVDSENSENPKQPAQNGNLSEFTIPEILRYVRLCADKGDAIKNPPGLAANLYKTGSADAFIRAALYPERQEEVDRQIYGEPRAFTADPCTACFGAKMSDPDGKGFRPCERCQNEKGKSTGLEPKGEISDEE